jgi:hypothetical protein
MKQAIAAGQAACKASCVMCVGELVERVSW